MFAQHSLTLARDPARVVAALAAPDTSWRVDLDGDGSEHLARMGVRVGGLPLYRRVRLMVGLAEPGPGNDRAMLPVSWEAVGGAPIFPRFEGTLHVAPCGADATQLTLNASYDPPLGSLGALIDRTVMHRVAKETVADFLERLGDLVLARS